MHIVIKIILVLIIGYIIDKSVVQAWIDYGKIIQREPITVKSSLNYIGNPDFKISSKEKGINFSMSMWMYIKDWQYRSGLKKYVLRTDCFEIYIENDTNTLVLNVPYYKLPCDDNVCATCPFTLANSQSENFRLSTARKDLKDAEEKLIAARTKMMQEKQKWISKQDDARNASPSSSIWANIPPIENDKFCTYASNNSIRELLNQKNADNVMRYLDVNDSSKLSQNINDGKLVGKLLCKNNNYTSYCNHNTGRCGTSNDDMRASLELGHIFSVRDKDYTTQHVYGHRGASLQLDDYQSAIKDYLKIKQTIKNLRNNIQLSLESIKGYEKILYTKIPLQRWLNLTVIVENRTIDLWVNNKLQESLYLPNIPIISSITDLENPCGDGFDGFISGLTVWDHRINKNMIYYMTNNSPVYPSIYDSTIGKFYRHVDKAIDYIQENYIDIDLKINTPKPKDSEYDDVIDNTCNV